MCWYLKEAEDRDESRSRGESLSADESWVTGASGGRGETKRLRGLCGGTCKGKCRVRGKYHIGN